MRTCTAPAWKHCLTSSWMRCAPFIQMACAPLHRSSCHVSMRSRLPRRRLLRHLLWLHWASTMTLTMSLRLLLAQAILWAHRQASWRSAVSSMAFRAAGMGCGAVLSRQVVRVERRLWVACHSGPLRSGRMRLPTRIETRGIRSTHTAREPGSQVTDGPCMAPQSVPIHHPFTSHAMCAWGRTSHPALISRAPPLCWCPPMCAVLCDAGP